MTQSVGSTRLEIQRGQTAVLGVVLLVGIVAVGSIGILIVGSTANQQAKESANAREIQLSFVKLGEDIDTVARQRTDNARDVDLDLPESTDFAIRVNDVGNIWVNKTNYSADTKTTVIDKSIGVIRFTQDDGTTIAYQGGGVWREQGNGTRLISSPEFAYYFNESGRYPTVTLPIVALTGDQRLDTGKLRMKKVGTVSPLNDVSIVENDLITVKVQSKWYAGWAKYFRELSRVANVDANASVEVDHANNTATLKLIVPVERKAVKSALLSPVAGQDLRIDSNMVVDSYNSSNGPYAATSGTNGTIQFDGSLHMNSNAEVYGDIVADENLRMNSNAEIYGDAEANGWINLSSNARITGNASYGTDFVDTSNNGVGGWVNDNASAVVPEVEPVGVLVNSRISLLEGSNDNGNESNIVGNRFSGCIPKCEIKPGNYYLDKISLNNEVIVLNTTNGTINLAVDGDMILNGNTKIFINNSHRVNLYLGGNKLKLDSNSFITVPGQRAKRFWLYAPPGLKAIFNSNSVMDGVLYAPGTKSKPGDFQMKSNSHIYGAVVATADKLDSNAYIHYDTSLSNAKTIVANTKIPKLTFLHAVVYKVCVFEADDGPNKCASINSPPSANTDGPWTVDEGNVRTLDGSSSSDSDGSIVSYSWSILSGPGSLTDANTPTPEYSAPASVSSDTSVTVKLTVTDNASRTGSVTQTITVNNLGSNSAPTAGTNGSWTVDEGKTQTLNGSAPTYSSDSDGSISSYSWSISSGPGSLTDANTPTPEYNAPSVSSDTSVTVELTVTDNDGATDTTTETITVEDTGTSAQMGLAFVGKNTGDLKTVNTSNSVTTYSTQQIKAIGPGIQLYGDSKPEIPFKGNSNGYLLAVNSTDNSKALNSKQIKSTRFGVGDWDGDGTPSVFYVRDKDLYKVEGGGAPSIVPDTDTGISVLTVSGVADFNDDGDRDLVFVDSSGHLVYKDGGTLHGTSGSIATLPAPKAVSGPADYDADGRIEVGFYDSGSITLATSAGVETTVNPSPAPTKSSMAPIDWTGDGVPEIAFVGANSEVIRYYDFDTGTTGSILDGSGNPIPASKSVGVAHKVPTPPTANVVPTVTIDSATQENSRGNKFVRVKFTPADPDGNLQSATVTVTDKNGNVVGSKTVSISGQEGSQVSVDISGQANNGNVEVVVSDTNGASGSDTAPVT